MYLSVHKIILWWFDGEEVVVVVDGFDCGFGCGSMGLMVAMAMVPWVP